MTSFLFAFSGGQYRMVPIVNTGAVIVIALGLIAAALASRTHSRMEIIRWTAIVTAASWALAIGIEWLVSFRLGA